MKDTISLARKVSDAETVSKAAERYALLRSECEQAYMDLILTIESVKNIDLGFPNFTEQSLRTIKS